MYANIPAILQRMIWRRFLAAALLLALSLILVLTALPIYVLILPMAASLLSFALGGYLLWVGNNRHYRVIEGECVGEDEGRGFLAGRNILIRDGGRKIRIDLPGGRNRFHKGEQVRAYVGLSTPVYEEDDAFHIQSCLFLEQK